MWCKKQKIGVKKFGIKKFGIKKLVEKANILVEKNWWKKQILWCKKAKYWCKKKTHVKIWLFSIFRGRTPKSKVTLSQEWIENVMTGISGVIELRNYTNFHSERWVINSG